MVAVVDERRADGLGCGHAVDFVVRWGVAVEPPDDVAHVGGGGHRCFGDFDGRVAVRDGASG